VIAIVLTRIGVFRLHMLKAKQAAAPAAPKEQPKQSPDQITP
jgi:hypothetical protein